MTGNIQKCVIPVIAKRTRGASFGFPIKKETHS